MGRPCDLLAIVELFHAASRLILHRPHCELLQPRLDRTRLSLEYRGKLGRGKALSIQRPEPLVVFGAPLRVSIGKFLANSGDGVRLLLGSVNSRVVAIESRFNIRVLKSPYSSVIQLRSLQPSSGVSIR